MKVPSTPTLVGHSRGLNLPQKKTIHVAIELPHLEWGIVGDLEALPGKGRVWGRMEALRGYDTIEPTF